jgi:peptidoglycan/xylan/chitin deacetylase (PgdA/CDA1 family)
MSLLALTGCQKSTTSSAPIVPPQSSGTPAKSGTPGMPSTTGTPAPNGTPGTPATSTKPATPGTSPKPTKAPPLTLAQVLAKLPRFAAGPTPVPIQVKDGPSAPIFYRMPTTAKVAFLTIDDGIVQQPQDLTVMKAAHIPFTMFLIGPVAAKNPPFFRQLVGDGGVIEDHTLTHPDLKGKSYAYQKNQICGAKTVLTKAFGSTATLFRPPYGDYDATTLKVVHDCGLQAAFYWSETVNDGKVYYQTSLHQIRPGDIILMHFRPAFPLDVLAALTAISKAGLTPALLTDYISCAACNA